MIRYMLHIHNSRRDTYGNCYYAFTFVDTETNQSVMAKVSGGESNIRGMTRYWNVPNDWDRSIQVVCNELPIREFNRLTKDWPEAGCAPEDIAAFIRKHLPTPPPPDGQPKDMRKIALKMKRKGYKVVVQLRTKAALFGEPLFFKSAAHVGPFMRTFSLSERCTLVWAKNIEEFIAEDPAEAK